MYPWYESIDEEVGLEQGDMLNNFPVPQMLPLSAGAAPDQPRGYELVVFDVIILTQSCDLLANKVDNVLVCPYFQPSDLEEVAGLEFTKSARGREKIQRGEMPSLHTLPPMDTMGADDPCLIVNFRQAAAVPFGWVEAQARSAGQRLRLLPPYREHLAQAFGRFVMRVGLPRDFRTK